MASKASTQTKKLPASVQFYDNIDTITELLERRFPVKLIWEELRKDNNYTGDYTHFCRLVKKEFDTKPQPKKSISRPPLKNPTNKSQSDNPLKTERLDDKKEDGLQEDDEDGPVLFMADLPRPKGDQK